jgi:toxin ParE1/3/4
MADSPVKFEVLLTAGAEQDLEAIYDYIADFDCVANANYVLDELLTVVESLSRFPERGSYPRELAALGIKEYRQTSFKPYRVIYRVIGDQVVIYLIVDGRRDMQSVLARRLLGACIGSKKARHANYRAGLGFFKTVASNKAQRKLYGLPNFDLVRDKPMPGQTCST